MRRAASPAPSRSCSPIVCDSFTGTSRGLRKIAEENAGAEGSVMMDFMLAEIRDRTTDHDRVVASLAEQQRALHALRGRLDEPAAPP